jgi:hypothetical protein
MNVAAHERPKISVRIRKNISGPGHRRLREGDSGRLKGRIWCNAAGAQDSRSADPFKRAGRAKLAEREERPQRLQPRDRMRHSDRVLRAVLELADRRDLVLAAELTGLRRQLIDVVAEIDRFSLREEPIR